MKAILANAGDEFEMILNVKVNLFFFLIRFATVFDDFDIDFHSDVSSKTISILLWANQDMQIFFKKLEFSSTYFDVYQLIVLTESADRVVDRST